MADQKLDELTLIPNATVATDLIYVVRDGVDYKADIANVALDKSQVGLSSVTDDAQTKAAIVPNDAPAAGEVLVGNAGGTAYAKAAISGDATLATTGALTLANTNVTAGTYTLATVTVDAKGRVTAASNGSATAGGTRTLARFTALDNNPPASNYATLDTRNSILVLDFDDGATNEESVFVGMVPEAASLGSGLKVRIYWMATSATSGNCRWGVQFADLSDQDIDGLTFDTVAEAHTATSGTSGIAVVTEITITDIDDIGAGVPFALKVYRDSSDTTNDTMTGDAELVAVEVRSAA